ncbi:MAG: peptide-methionine (S)-S-oxide reductase MsrA [Acidobacteria bacterium]|nr:peptide-methionine (S)-S-oxide reductase MsrA [Acidobacteriota bacterium]MBI3663982.1 peptide-methionine (S)-S-oxide reductase MsrA [Acidobacteriota bacterium]
MKKFLLFLALLALVCAVPATAQNSPSKQPAPQKQPATASKFEVATFAGGCFWCMQPPFDVAKGVISTVVGYTDGKEKNPTYEQVSNRQTGHRESVQVTFDPAQISYDQLLDIFWRSFNPTQADGQFADIGPQYRAAIFYHSEEQKRIAEQSRERLAKSGKFKKPIVTEILPASAFYPAEEYHQKYYLKNPADYNRYKVGSGRAGFLHSVWGDEARH